MAISFFCIQDIDMVFISLWKSFLLKDTVTLHWVVSSKYTPMYKLLKKPGSFVGVINISCDISNSCIKFYGEVPKGLASSILETYEEEDTLPVIDNAIPDRYGRGNYNAAVTCCHNTSTYITRSLHRLIGYKTRFSDKEC